MCVDQPKPAKFIGLMVDGFENNSKVCIYTAVIGSPLKAQSKWLTLILKLYFTHRHISIKNSLQIQVKTFDSSFWIKACQSQLTNFSLCKAACFINSPHTKTRWPWSENSRSIFMKREMTFMCAAALNRKVLLWLSKATVQNVQTHYDAIISSV